MIKTSEVSVWKEQNGLDEQQVNGKNKREKKMSRWGHQTSRSDCVAGQDLIDIKCMDDEKGTGSKTIVNLVIEDAEIWKKQWESEETEQLNEQFQEKQAKE